MFDPCFGMPYLHVVSSHLAEEERAGCFTLIVLGHTKKLKNLLNSASCGSADVY